MALGFVRPDGQPDVRRFCLENRYDKTIFYEWIADRSTPTKDLARLCVDLGINEAWLIFGRSPEPPSRRGGRRPVIAGGSTNVVRPEVEHQELKNINDNCLLSDLARKAIWRWFPRPSPQWA